MNNEMKNKKVNRKINKKILALTLGLGLAVGSLTGSYTIAQANERPAGIENKQTGQAKLIFEEADHQDLLKLLKIDEEAFKKDADRGMSLTEIAGSYHVSRKPVVDVVVKNLNKQIDKALAEKRITEEQATQLKTTSMKKAQVIVDIKPIGFDKENSQDVNEKQGHHEMSDKQNPQDVNNKEKSLDVSEKKGPQDINEKQNPQKVNEKQSSQNVNNEQKSKGNNQSLQEMLTLLKIDAQTFQQEQASGKSLAEIAAAHNVPRQAVVDLVTKDMNQQIETGLAEKRITVEQAEEMKANAVQKIQEMVDKSMIDQPTQPAQPQK